ncbi:MAG TPA: thioesterase domain-containing protein, partial [Vicinamibacterales bacterium]|nr:thioesterase domain-containing protein [Vicinamibacterales bacterium]
REALLAHARRQLPDYMVPSAVVVLDALPQTPTGKLDPKTLPAPDYAGESTGDGPRDFLEVQLLHIWEQLLGLELIVPTQNFFELGGNSLLALRLFAQIRNRLHYDLPASLLFSHATVRDMADAIREQHSADAGAPMAVVPLQPNGSLPPIFCVHPAGPEVHAYVNIVRHLGGDQPVYGVRDVGNDFTRPLLRVASDHVAAIRAVQPHGPYFIVGWSFGGNVAYEMAVLLERQGETVAFVGLIDTLATVVGAQSLDVAGAALVVGVAGDFAEQMGWPFAVQTSELDGMTFDEQMRYVTDALHAGRGGDTSETVAWLRQGCEIMRARSISRQGYVPNPYTGTLTLFRASDVRDDLNERFVSRMAAWTAEEQRTVGWSELTPVPVEVHWVPGTHGTVGSEPNVRVLAQRMRESLVAARALAGEHTLAS